MELDARAAISLIALSVSAVSLWLGIRNWRQSNRPIVAAFLRTRKSGNTGTVFDLVLTNAGSRPATHIQLSCDRGQYRAALAEPSKSEPLVEAVEHCFDPGHYVPVLLNGESTSNSFGAVSIKPGESTWKPGASFPVVTTYRDFEGRRFENEWVIVIRDTDSFAGGQWAEPAG